MANLSFGFLDWRGPKTTKNSLNSYLYGGLFYLCDQTIYFGQEYGTLSASEVLNFGFSDSISSDRNLGIADAFKQMVEICETDYFMFLENDWELVELSPVISERLSHAMSSIEEGAADIVRLRHRKNPGDPLHTRQFEGRELDSPRHMLDCVHWLDHPEDKFPLVFEQRNGLVFTNAQFANFTNNPCIYNTQFLKREILPKLTSGSNLEDDLNPIWPMNPAWIVAQGEGLFSHQRID